MAYTPKTWECGETITADALNHMEQGIADCGGADHPVEVVRVTREDEQGNVVFRADKTLSQLIEASQQGVAVIACADDPNGNHLTWNIPLVVSDDNYRYARGDYINVYKPSSSASYVTISDYMLIITDEDVNFTETGYGVKLN